MHRNRSQSSDDYRKYLPTEVQRAVNTVQQARVSGVAETLVNNKDSKIISTTTADAFAAYNELPARVLPVANIVQKETLSLEDGSRNNPKVDHLRQHSISRTDYRRYLPSELQHDIQNVPTSHQIETSLEQAPLRVPQSSGKILKT